MIKRIVQNIKQNKVLYTIIILSFSLAIAFAMVAYMMYHLRGGDYGAEPYRSRMLFSDGGTSYRTSDQSNVESGMSEQTARAIFDNLEGVEMVAYNRVYKKEQGLDSYNSFRAYVGAEKNSGRLAIAKLVAPNFFKMYNIRFLEGQPFVEEDNAPGSRVCIVSDRLANELIGEGQPHLGAFIRLDNNLQFKVIGVVEEVSSVFNNAYGEVYFPANLVVQYIPGSEGIRGNVRPTLLLQEGASKKAVRAAIERNVQRFNETLTDYTFKVEVEDSLQRALPLNKSSNTTLLFLLVILVFIVIPGVTMSGMISTLIERRSVEIGVRKAYGSNVWDIMKNFLLENIIVTLFASLIGFLLAWVVVYFGREWMVAGAMGAISAEGLTLPLSGLFSLPVLLTLLVFCVLLSVISVLVPAYRHSHASVVESLKLN